MILALLADTPLPISNIRVMKWTGCIPLFVGIAALENLHNNHEAAGNVVFHCPDHRTLSVSQ